MWSRKETRHFLPDSLVLMRREIEGDKLALWGRSRSDEEACAVALGDRTGAKLGSRLCLQWSRDKLLGSQHRVFLLRKIYKPIKETLHKPRRSGLIATDFRTKPR